MGKKEKEIEESEDPTVLNHRLTSMNSLYSFFILTPGTVLHIEHRRISCVYKAKLMLCLDQEFDEEKENGKKWKR